MVKSIIQKKLSYIESPCERCGSERIISKLKNKKIKNSFGDSQIETFSIICLNKLCQNSFDKQRANDLITINARKLEREERNKERQLNIAKTISTRKGLTLQKN